MAKRKFGEAQVEVSIRDRVGQGLKAIEHRLKAFAMRMRAIGGSIAGVGTIATGAFGGVGAALLGASSKFGTFGDQIQKTSARLNTSAKFLTGLKFAAEQSGSSLESVANAMFRANRRIANATKGTGPAVRALNDLGLSADQLNNLSTEDRFLAISDALANMQNETLAAQYGFEIFGDNFRDIKPLIDEGSDGIRQLTSEAESLGLTLGDNDANGAAAYADAMNRMKQSVTGAVVQIGAALAPAIKSAAAIFTRVTTRVSLFIRKNRGLVVAVGAATAVAFTFGAALAAAGVTIAGVGVAVGVFGSVVSAVGAALAVVAKPLAIVAAAVGGLGGAALYASGGFAKLGKMFLSIRDTAVHAWSGITAALASGDLAIAGEIGFTALKIAWLKTTNDMKQVYFDAINYIKDIFLDLGEGTIHLGANIYFGVAKYFDKLANSLLTGFDTAFTYIRGGIDRIQTSISKAIISAGRFFGMFSKDEAAQVQSSLDANLERRAEEREKGLGRRIGSLGQELYLRDQQRKSQASDFTSDTINLFNDQKRQRAGPDQEGVVAAQEELARLNAKLASTVQKARQDAVSAAKLPGAGDQGFDLAAVFGAQAQSQIKARGTSSAAAVAAGALDIGRSDDKMRKLVVNTDKNNRLMLRLINKRGGFR